MASRIALTFGQAANTREGPMTDSKSWRAKNSAAGPSVVFHSFSIHVKCASELRQKCRRNSERLWPPSGQGKRSQNIGGGQARRQNGILWHHRRRPHPAGLCRVQEKISF